MEQSPFLSVSTSAYADGCQGKMDKFEKDKSINPLGMATQNIVGSPLSTLIMEVLCMVWGLKGKKKKIQVLFSGSHGLVEQQTYNEVISANT